ncbi:MAG: aminopeptidase [Brevibacillus sp.]|nr:aminopeptidase [Brevibacillus sp.]
MKSEQLGVLAERIVCHSLALLPGERVLIEMTGEADALVETLIEQVYQVGAVPHLRINSIRHLRKLIAGCSEEQLRQLANWESERQKECEAYIGIKAEENQYEMSDLPKEKYDLYLKHYLQPLTMTMATMKKWLLLRYPTYGMAQLARISLPELSERFYRACTLDYGKLAERVEPLIDLLKRTERVRIVGEHTDLQFSIKGMPAFLCDGRYNLPDGELFTAPLLDSAEGEILFNVAASYLGMTFEKVRLRFEAGRVVEADASDRERLWQILQTDEGATRLGEFGIGLNPYVNAPMNNLSFDEKMAGSIHLALGHAYDMADNGNRSSIHWDLVLCQTAEQGGGELWFDDQLIRKDGRFVPPELRPLDHWHREDERWPVL